MGRKRENRTEEGENKDRERKIVVARRRKVQDSSEVETHLET